MSLSRFGSSAISTSLLFGCASAPPPARTPMQARQVDANYITIQAEVSLSRTAQPAEEKQAALDPNADVMAEILAIPPGR